MDWIDKAFIFGFASIFLGAAIWMVLETYREGLLF